MPHNVVAAQPPAILMTRVWLLEHDWLHSVYTSNSNQSPTFRFPDLLSACIELVLSSTESPVSYTHLTLPTSDLV